MFCETGVIGRLSGHGLAKKVQTSDEIEYYENSYCDIATTEEN